MKETASFTSELQQKTDSIHFYWIDRFMLVLCFKKKSASLQLRAKQNHFLGTRLNMRDITAEFI